MSSINDNLIEALLNKNRNEAIQILINNPQDPDINNGIQQTGWTPLILAIKNNDREIVGLILRNNSLRMNKTDKDGWPAYKHAVIKERTIDENPNIKLGNINDIRQIIRMLENDQRLSRDLGKDPRTGRFEFDLGAPLLRIGGKITKMRRNNKKTYKTNKIYKNYKNYKKLSKRHNKMRKQMKIKRTTTRR